jgi:hypothetical protein
MSIGIAGAPTPHVDPEALNEALRGLNLPEDVRDACPWPDRATAEAAGDLVRVAENVYFTPGAREALAANPAGLSHFDAETEIQIAASRAAQRAFIRSGFAAWVNRNQGHAMAALVAFQPTRSNDYVVTLWTEVRERVLRIAAKRAQETADSDGTGWMAENA